jgi:hypothetical protein
MPNEDTGDNQRDETGYECEAHERVLAEVSLHPLLAYCLGVFFFRPWAVQVGILQFEFLFLGLSGFRH